MIFYSIIRLSQNGLHPNAAAMFSAVGGFPNIFGFYRIARRYDALISKSLPEVENFVSQLDANGQAKLSENQKELYSYVALSRIISMELRSDLSADNALAIARRLPECLLAESSCADIYRHLVAKY